MKTLIKNAAAVLPEGMVRTDVLIDGTKIARIDPAVQTRADQVVDARGLVLMPGVIDDQVHFREPGSTHKEDLETATRACAAGGVTTFLEMPNTSPPATNMQRLQEKLALAARKSLVNYGFYIGATPRNLTAKIAGGATMFGERTERDVGEKNCVAVTRCLKEHAIPLLAEHIGGSRRILLWAMLAAILVSAAGSGWVTLSLCYEYGGINTSWIIQGLVHYPFNFISRNIANGTPLNWDGWLWTAYGGAFMGLLTFLKQRLLWWPIHPISLPISTLYMTDMLMLSVFIAWLVKALILKYGGPKLFDRGKPFFVGLVVGQFTCMGFWLVVDHFTGMKGNIVYWM